MIVKVSLKELLPRFCTVLIDTVIKVPVESGVVVIPFSVNKLFKFVHETKFDYGELPIVTLQPALLMGNDKGTYMVTYPSLKIGLAKTNLI